MKNGIRVRGFSPSEKRTIDMMIKKESVHPKSKIEVTQQFVNQTKAGHNFKGTHPNITLTYNGLKEPKTFTSTEWNDFGADILLNCVLNKIEYD